MANPRTKSSRNNGNGHTEIEVDELVDFVDDREIASIEDLVQDTSERQSDLEPIELNSGKIVVVKPLSRKQALQFKGSAKMPRELFEQRAVSMALVAPRMTPKQVSEWQDQDKANGDLHKIIGVILRISGMEEKVSDPKDPKSAD